MNVFLIMCLQILIVLTLLTFTSNWFHNLTPISLIDINFLFILQNITLKLPFLLDLVPYEYIFSIVIEIFWWLENNFFLAL